LLNLQPLVASSSSYLSYGEVKIGLSSIEPYNRNSYSVKYPIEHGVVVDWDDMEKVWHHVFASSELRRGGGGGVEGELLPLPPVLCTEPILNPMPCRERTLQVMLETFQVPKFYLANTGVLVMYGGGRVCGVAMECGDGVTTALPVVEGYAVRHAMARRQLGGRDVTDYLVSMLNERGFSFSTGPEREVVREIKESLCAVNLEVNEEMLTAAIYPGCYSANEATHQLPDGHIMSFGDERFRAPEVLFRPLLANINTSGIHEMLFGAIMKSEVDARKILFSNIVLGGGTTMMPGFAERLQREITQLAPMTARTTVVALPERKSLAWIGGSIWASLSATEQIWITQAEFQEVGISVLYRKGFV